MKVSVGVSARHVHLTRETVDALFGENYVLTKKKDLSQPGQFACEETVTIQTEKGSLERLRILGPVRPYNQIELSRTDAFKLGLNPPVRNSGDVEGSEPITLVGPKGTVALEKGCIIPTRHIHMTREQKETFDVRNDFVSVRVFGEKGGILENVFLKEAEQANMELHLDTDDANAHLISQGDIVEIIGE